MPRLIGLRPDGSDPAEEVERFRAAFRREEDRADARAQAFDDLVVRVWRAATGDTHEGPASVEVLLAAVSDLREQLREIRRTVIASVRGEEHAAALTSAALDERAASTGEDVACLVARMRTAEADNSRLRTDNDRLDDVARGALDDLARVRAELDAARAHLRSHIHCDSCDRLATRTHPDTARFGCDVCGVGEGWADTTHAAAVRAAVKR